MHGSEPKPGTKGSTDFWMANILRINYLPPPPTPHAHTRQHLQETPQIVWSYLDTSTNILFGMFLGSDMALRGLGCVCEHKYKNTWYMCVCVWREWGRGCYLNIACPREERQCRSFFVPCFVTKLVQEQVHNSFCVLVSTYTQTDVNINA